MHARLTATRFADGAAIDAVIRVVDEELIPALRRVPGFVGYEGLLDRAAGTGLAVSLWATEAQARALRQDAAIGALLARLEALGVELGSPVIYEVTNRA